MKLASKTKTIPAQWLALLTIFGTAVLLGPSVLFAQTTEALDDSAISPPGGSVDIYVLENDTAGTGTLTVQSYVQPSNGTVSGPNADGSLTYAPKTGFTSTDPDTFRYTAIDTAGSYATATVYVYVGTEITTFNIIPKKLNVKKNGVIPVVIRSTEGFDVTKIDPSTITLAGHSTNHFHMGKKKFTLKFRAQDIVGPIREEVSHGDEVELYLTGIYVDPLLGDDSPFVFVGRDTVTIIKKGKQN
jgi:hypothetical protein